jgi:hypothetical protein
MPTYVLRDLRPGELHALGADLVAAEQHGEDLRNVLEVWEAIR